MYGGERTVGGHPGGTAVIHPDDTGWSLLLFHNCGQLVGIAHACHLHRAQEMALMALDTLHRADQMHKMAGKGHIHADEEGKPLKDD